MVKKAFIILQFGQPHEWTQKFIDHVQPLHKDGWDFLIVTPNKFESKGNVKIIPLSIEDFNQLVKSKLDVDPHLYITDKGIPSYHVTDFMVGFGAIFEDYLKGYDFWGLVGIDCVIGDLSKFVTDRDLQHADIWSDDINAINGNFSLWRNIPEINYLFKYIGNWKEAFSQEPCAGCLGTGRHTLYGTDELTMTKIVRKAADNGMIQFKTPKFYIHEHDKLENHMPEPKLILEPGKLYAKLSYPDSPSWEHAYDNFAHEIAYFHFSRTKVWPIK